MIKNGAPMIAKQVAITNKNLTSSGTNNNPLTNPDSLIHLKGKTKITKIVTSAITIK